MHQQSGKTVTELRVRGLIDRMLSAADRVEHPSSAALVKKYLVLSTPRTGSTMFCRALENAGAGWPTEWFNPLYMLQAQTAFGASSLDIQNYVQKLVLGTYNAAANVFGVNVHVEHYLFLKQQGYDLFTLGFDHVYYIHRRNKAKQAYSLAKSEVTGFWSREAEIQAGHIERIAADITPVQFCRALTGIVAACDYAETALRDRIHRTYCFEDLIGGTFSAAVSEVLSDLTITQNVPSSIPTKRQSGNEDGAGLQRVLERLGF